MILSFMSGKVWLIRAAHIMADKKPEGNEGSDRAKYSSQGHALSDLLSPAFPNDVITLIHLRMNPYTRSESQYLISSRNAL